VSGTLRLAWRFVAFHRTRTIVLVACLALTISLPVSMRILVQRFEQQLTLRAESTPLVVGASGSRVDLVLHALYFRGQPPRESAMREVDRITNSGYATAIPVFARFRAGGFSLIGTTSEYFTFRQLRLARGNNLRRLGDCLIGSRVATERNLIPGDALLSEAESAFDPDGSFPLKMRVAGVLAESGTPDDEAVFVEIHTAWIIAGVGHGHVRPQVPTDVEQQPGDAGDSSEPVHDPGLIEFTEITDENADAFHFHGPTDRFPVTAIIAIPHDDRSATLLMGRYLDADDPSQLLNPVDVIQELLQFVVRLRQFFDMAFAVLSAVTVLFFMLVMALSVRLRQREFETMHRLGCSRLLIIRLVATELLIVVMMSLSVCVVLQIGIWFAMPWVVTGWLAA
jgi:putative ABC transport system permease protein